MAPDHRIGRVPAIVSVAATMWLGAEPVLRSGNRGRIDPACEGLVNLVDDVRATKAATCQQRWPNPIARHQFR